MSTRTSRGRSTVLQAERLTVEIETTRGTIRPVNDVSFRLTQGRTLGLVGESGSGKSMTALALMGLLPGSAARLTSGTIEFEGRDLAQLPAHELRRLRGTRIAMVFQDPMSSLNPVYPVGYQIAEMFFRHGRLSRRKAFHAAVELMERVRIPDAPTRAHAYPHQFSGGMRQRVMIAMSLALRPAVLIADEPTTALDVTVQAQILELLKQLQREENMAILFISHDLGVVADIAEEVAVMYAGRIVEQGGLRAVYDTPAHPYTRSLMASAPSVDADVPRLATIAGIPPSLHTVPTGCSFHPRCPAARSRCQKEDPLLRPVADGRAAACHFTEEVLSGDV